MPTRNTNAPPSGKAFRASKPRKNIIGHRNGRLEVTEFVGRYGRRFYYRCRCDCGNHVVVDNSNILYGRKNSKSCGCLNRELITKHGRYLDPVYGIWAAIRDRCGNPNSAGYVDYGGRGIKVCERWQSFENFYADIGHARPSSSHSLDRIDNNGGYCLENCKWSTWQEQAYNRRSNRFLIYNGETHCLTEWAKLRKLTQLTLRGRLKRNWPLGEALGFIPHPKYVRPKKVHS